VVYLLLGPLVYLLLDLWFTFCYTFGLRSVRPCGLTSVRPLVYLPVRPFGLPAVRPFGLPSVRPLGYLLLDL
jgi:hypothetical protein